MTLRPCLTCGEPSDGSWCSDHRRNDDHTLTRTERGYDNRWARLSARARRLQPWCSDCGAVEDLTGDHLRWPARTLADVDVVCRSCNSARGPVRTQGTDPRTNPAGPAGKPERALHTPRRTS